MASFQSCCWAARRPFWNGSFAASFIPLFGVGGVCPQTGVLRANNTKARRSAVRRCCAATQGIQFLAPFGSAVLEHPKVPFGAGRCDSRYLANLVLSHLAPSAASCFLTPDS